MHDDSQRKIEKKRMEALSEFRFRLRSFLRFSEDAARDAGITVLQYGVDLFSLSKVTVGDRALA